jgi:hypothetical protein
MSYATTPIARRSQLPDLFAHQYLAQFYQI